jgi:hypothetical protein
LTFENVLNDNNLSKERITELRKYKMLFLPVKNYRNKEGYFFHSATRDFYLYCKSENPDNNFEFCTEKSEYKELLLNANEFYLGTLILRDILIPIFTGLIANYLFKILTNKDDKINTNIIIQNSNTNKSDEITFRGTKKDFDEKVLNSLLTYSKHGKFIKSDKKGGNVDVLS